MKFKQIWHKILKFLYPDKFTCCFCRDEIFDDDDIETCGNCKNKLPFITGKVCEKCGEPINNMANYCEMCNGGSHIFKKARSVFIYKDNIVSAIVNFKFKNKRYFYKPFAKYLQQIYIENNYCCDVIIPVPIHKSKLKERGYNQCELIAKRLSKLLNISVDSNSLVKIKQTINQVDLNFKQRRENLKGAFKVIEKNKIKNKVVLLIDDVYTTGSTLDACCYELKKAGAKEVFALTVAHTVVKLI